MIDQGKKNVVGVLVDVVDYDGALARIHAAAQRRSSCTISALAVHGVMTGATSATQRYRLNHLDMVVPDGQPVRWALNFLYKAKLENRVYGPELTLKTLLMAERENLPVYFYGSTEEVLASLKRQLAKDFPRLQIAGLEPSKFRSLTQVERGVLADKVIASGAQILFVGLGCPRQEVFAYEMRALLPMPLLAVGAAFTFLAGELAQAPPVLQRFGLEWLFRLKEEPRRLWRRYLYLNPYYLLLLFRQMSGHQYSSDGSEPIHELRYG